MRPPRRVLPAALVTVSAVAVLAGCASTGTGGTGSSPSASTAPSASSSAAAALTCASAGSASAAVKVSGAAGKEPTVSFPTPTTAATTQRTVLKQGSGAAVKQGSSVSIAYAMYDARSGKKLDSRGWGSTNAVVLSVDPVQYLPGIAQALNCTKAGERFAAVLPASTAFGSQGSEQLGVQAGDDLVFVADVVGITPTKATGAAKALPSGFPKVTLASSGQPTVAIPATDPPKALRIAASEVGTGETVKEGDTVTVQYQGVLWRTGKVFDQSWGRGPTSFATGAVVKGFGKALVGQKVGSQVVTIVPPSEGYGTTGSQDGSIKGTDTMVFVIDILATAHAS